MSTGNTNPFYSCSIDVTPATDTPVAAPNNDVNANLGGIQRQLNDLTRCMQELLEVSKEQLRVAQRGEERFVKQQQQQRDEFKRWVGENYALRGKCAEAQEVIRALLGRTMTELVDYVRDHEEHFEDSEFIRQDMVDRFGSLLNHVSGIHLMLKRLTAVDQMEESSVS